VPEPSIHTEDAPSATRTTRQLVLARHLDGRTTSDVFRIEEVALPPLPEGGALVRVHYLSVDPAMRTWAAPRPGRGQPLPVGSVMRAYAVGIVHRSRNADLPEGVALVGTFGARTWHVTDGSDVRRIWDPAPEPLSVTLGILGHVGLTAMVGLTLIAPPRPDETVLVSSAAGAVGALAGQIARLMGARVVGVAGGPVKTAICRSDYGFDTAIDHQDATDLAEAIRLAAPEGIDVFFDNVGGRVLDAALPNMNPRGRIAVCGTIGVDSARPGLGPRMERTILDRELSIRGFLQSKYESESTSLLPTLRGWYEDGRLVLREDVSRGLASLPEALERLLAGGNLGKALIDITKEDS
jgi:NADPH-dependent curcumin reductase